MKQILQSARSGKLEVKNVPAPRADKGEIFIKEFSQETNKK